MNSSIPCVTREQVDCFLRVNQKKQVIFDSCSECPVECDLVTYDLATSTSGFPGQNYAEILVNNTFLNNLKPELKSGYSDLKESVLSFSVYYSELQYTEINQLEKLSLIDLICDIGGTLGLFIGASLLSFVELLEGFISVAFLFKRKETANTCKK